MAEAPQQQKTSPFPDLERETLRFWKENKVVDRVLSRKPSDKEHAYVFYEGPPTANAGPGLHHVIARAFKDIIPRYKTLRGYSVVRKAGWDTHGLPVELQVEKEIGTKTKSDIEAFGIAAFNKKCKETVWRFKQKWDEFTERIGYWLDLEHPYVTYHASYMESVWWILKQMWQKQLLAQDYKVVPYCSRCETPLSSHEVAQGYQDVQDTSVYIKFKVKDEKYPDTYFLAWTTTPWTLPGNVGLAVNPDIDYVLVTNVSTKENYFLAKQIFFAKTRDGGPHRIGLDENAGEFLGMFEILKEMKGSDLVGMRYEPLFPYLQQIKPKNIENAYQVLPAEFATATEGTGIVHTAVMYGVEDFDLGKQYQLPEYHTVDIHGHFIPEVVPWAGKWVKDKEVEQGIIQWLKDHNILYRTEVVTHTYPFCWRCKSPLLYYAHESWFVKMSTVRQKLIDNNEKIAWVPEHLQHGRFGEWLNDIKDWALSRERYWGTPLPAWICDADKNHQLVVGSVDELGARAYKPNTYILVRHGGATSTERHYYAAWPEKQDMVSELSETGRKEVEKTARELAGQGVSMIISSDLTRTKQTADIIAKACPQAEVKFDERLREVDFGVYNYQPVSGYDGFLKSLEQKPLEDQLNARPENGESHQDVLRRVAQVIRDCEKQYQGKTIVLVSHGGPLWLLESVLKHATLEQTFAAQSFKVAESRVYPAPNTPFNDDGFLDLHRPYVDDIVLACPECNFPMHRIRDVIDVWFDSGAMPFAQYHFPFDQMEPGQDPAMVDYKKLMQEKLPFPAQYISEAIDQTRGWFYTLHAIATALDLGPAFMHAISIGHVVDEKGEKMSKSKGNIVDPWQVMDQYGIDALRWYFYTVNDPGEYKRFALRDLGRSHQELLTIYNVVKFWQTYAPEKLDLAGSARSQDVLDQWMQARIKALTGRMEFHLDRYHVFEASRELQGFIDDLSRWYIRRSRRKLQKPDSSDELGQASREIAFVLKDVAVLLSPFVPFLAEHVWQAVRTRAQSPDEMPQSVHETSYPEFSNNEESKGRSVLDAMSRVRKAAETVLMLRAKSGMKVRQPLAAVELLEKDKFDESLQDILKDEVNVKETRFVKQFTQGFVQTTDASVQAALDTTLTEELRQEGALRELVRTVQEARQDAQLTPQDQITLYLEVPKEIILPKDAMAVLQKETTAKAVLFEKAEHVFESKLDLGGNTIWIGIKK